MSGMEGLPIIDGQYVRCLDTSGVAFVNSAVYQVHKKTQHSHFSEGMFLSVRKDSIDGTMNGWSPRKFEIWEPRVGDLVISYGIGKPSQEHEGVIVNTNGEMLTVDSSGQGMMYFRKDSDQYRPVIGKKPACAPPAAKAADKSAEPEREKHWMEKLLDERIDKTKALANEARIVKQQGVAIKPEVPHDPLHGLADGDKVAHYMQHHPMHPFNKDQYDNNPAYRTDIVAVASAFIRSRYKRERARVIIPGVQGTGKTETIKKLGVV